MLLSIRNLVVGAQRPQGTSELVRGISLDIASGEIVGLVGESGSGKSLTALSVPRLLPAGIQMLAGEVLLNGKDLVSMPDRALHRLRGKEIGFIFQDPLTALNPVLTIGTQLMDVVRAHFSVSGAEARQRAISSLRAVGIPMPERCMKAYPHQLSGGMRQRALIAMVVLGGPKLILADEPTTALDVTVQARIIRLLRSIQESAHAAILFISHNLDLVAEFCDRVVVLYGGRIMEQGSSAQIVQTPRHPYTRALMQCIPRLNGELGPLRVIPGHPPHNPGLIRGCPFADRCERRVAPCAENYPESTRHESGHTYHCFNPIPEGLGRHDD